MFDIKLNLGIWRSNRNLDGQEFVGRVEIANILEEYTEYLRAKNIYEQLDALCDMVVFSYNAIYYLREDVDYYLRREKDVYQLESVLSAVSYIRDGSSRNAAMFATIILLSKDRVESLGYNYHDCMRETFKEISSRLQDPQQMEEWASNGPTGKWRKDPNQLEATKYKADYGKCRNVA